MTAMLAKMHPQVDLTPPGQTDPDDVPEPPAEPISKRGDVWLLGNHRLMCGDSSDEADVNRLLAGAKPRLMVTDPPYGVNYEPEWRGTARRTGKVVNDDSTDWSGVFQGYGEITIAYVWCPPGDYQIVFANILMAANFHIRNQIIWRKQMATFSRGHYHWQHEPCWYAVREGASAEWVGDRKQSSVWDINRVVGWFKGAEVDKTAVTDNGVAHSTQKPVECMERPIRNHEGNIFDPFVGSGTTIIAAERQNRTCYAMEISEAYTDAAKARWENYTGQKAILEPSNPDESGH